MPDMVLGSWKKIYDGPHGEVWMHERCVKELGKIKETRMEAGIRSVMKNKFCQFEDLGDLHNEEFRREGNKQRNGRQLRLHAFKRYQLRVYGSIGNVANNRAFFAAVAVQKKEKKLDGNHADTCADRLQTVETEIKNAKL
ncbi:hypothetical protein [Ponticaulis profundi]|uniref:Uncharacterized protein n=1 Tax=Ponticaulis profundi TaxID=2665222 RepID=A0ABW1S6L1_9PROT